MKKEITRRNKQKKSFFAFLYAEKFIRLPEDQNE